MADKKKIAVVLSGCGVFDGSEAYETVLTLLRLSQCGAKVQCFAPDIEQLEVINHITGEKTTEKRNVLTEAARLVRGEISDVAQADAFDWDGLIAPGGYGAAKNLSDFAVRGADCEINPDFLSFAHAIHTQGKPIGLICIAPVMTAAIVGKGSRCTVGYDREVSQAINAMGAEHIECPVQECVVDKEHKLVTTPAYMLAQSISEAQKGIFSLVDEVLAMI